MVVASHANDRTIFPVGRIVAIAVAFIGIGLIGFGWFQLGQIDDGMRGRPDEPEMTTISRGVWVGTRQMHDHTLMIMGVLLIGISVLIDWRFSPPKPTAPPPPSHP